MNVGAVCIVLAVGGLAAAAEVDHAVAQDAAAPEVRPTIEADRWQEDWSVLSDPALRTEPFDALKYLPLSEDPQQYLSFGANLRERVESFDAAAYGTGSQRSNTYLLDRLQVHMDLHLDGWQLFVQIQDDRTAGKFSVAPVDADRVDLEQAFLAYTRRVGDGVLKLRAGRQEMAFDMQRFVSNREGPNVRQAFDALWADYEWGNWRAIAFVSHPTQYRDLAAFDDYSSHDVAFHGARMEHRAVGPGDLAIYYVRYENSASRFGPLVGMDKRNALDIHYSGIVGAVNFDAEWMGQQGEFAGRPVLAWATGSQLGYSFRQAPWAPHAYVQFDMASGSASAHGTFGTFNPLFPNGVYFPLSGLTTYANLVHVKPVVAVTPTKSLTLQAALGLQWRQTTHDAVYAIPTQAIAGTAGRGTAWTAAYLEFDAMQKINAHLSAGAQLVRYQIGDTLRAAGAHDTTYAMIQLAFGW